MTSAFGLEFTEVNDPDSVSETFGLFHIVGRVEDANSFVTEPRNAFQNSVAALGIDTHGWLIENEQPWAVEEADADVQATLHAARIFLCLVVGPIRQTNYIEYFPNPLLGLSAIQSIEPRKEAEILPGGEIGVDSDILRHQSNRRLYLDTGRRQRNTAHENFTSVLLKKSGDHGDRGCLASPVRTEEPVRLSLGDMEAEVIHGDEVAEGLAQIPAFKDVVASCHIAFIPVKFLSLSRPRRLFMEAIIYPGWAKVNLEEMNGRRPSARTPTIMWVL